MKSGKWKKLGIILAILVVLGAVVAIIVPRLIDPNEYHGRIVSEVQKAVGGEVRLGHITWGISKGVWVEVDGFSVKDAALFPGDVELIRVYARISLIPLLSKKIVLGELFLDGVSARLRLEKKGDGGKAGEEIAQSSDTAPPPVGILVKELRIRKGVVELEDNLTQPGKKIVRIISDFTLDATDIIPGEQIGFEFSMRDEEKPGLGALKAKGTFSGLTESLTIQDPRLHFKATLSSIYMEALKPFLKRDTLPRHLGGSLSLDLDYQGDLGKQFSAKGTADLTEITYQDPSLWEKAVPGVETRIDYQLAMKPGRIAVEHMNLRLGKLSITARALLENLGTAPVIKNAMISSDELPLKEIIPYVPWGLLKKEKTLLMQLLSSGGKITIEKILLPKIGLKGPIPDPKELLPQIEAAVLLSGLSLKPSREYPKIENIHGTVRLAKGVLVISGLTARAGPASLPKITAEIRDILNKPVVQARLLGPLTLDRSPKGEALKFLERYHIKNIGGMADMDLTMHLETARPESLQLEGKVKLRDVTLATHLIPASVEGLFAEILLTPETLKVPALKTAVLMPPADASPGGRFSIALEGHVDNWRKHPVLTLRKLTTSSISLPVLVSNIPWKHLGESAPMVRESLLSGGTVTIEDFAISKLDLKEPPKKVATLVPRMRGTIQFTNISLRPKPTLPWLKLTEGQARLEKGVLTATKVQAGMGPFTLPTIDMRATNLAGHPRVSAQFKGPVIIKGSDKPGWEKLLKQYGLKSLSGKADISMSADYDHAKPELWQAQGDLQLTGFRAVTHPEGIQMEDLRGHIQLNRKKALDLVIRDLRGRLNQAPVKLDAKVTGGGTPRMVVDATAQTKQLDLAHLSALVPPLKRMGLGGKVDADLDIHFPRANPESTRVKGTVITKNVGFHLENKGITVKEVNAHLTLTSKAITLKETTLSINEQKLEVSGRIENFKSPNARLFIASPFLDVDRLLPAPGKEPARPPSKPVVAKKKKKELPPMMRNLTAQVQVEADKGRYRGQEFKKLKFKADYVRGELKLYDLDVLMAGGSVTAKGSADLRDPEHIPFTMIPALSNVNMEVMAPLLGLKNTPAHGPLSMTGQLQGRTGARPDLMRSLNGNLAVDAGPGLLTKAGGGSGVLVNIMEFVSVSGILSGRVLSNVQDKGLAFKSIKAQADFSKGTMRVNMLRLISDAADINADGTVDLVTQRLNMYADVEPLQLADKALGIIPLLGKSISGITNVYLDVRGTLADPKIKVSKIKRTTKEEEKPAEKTTTPEKQLFDTLKGLKGLFGK
ncbi:MAG: AsmA-like C-terminal domain-containing protein [Deltaproteobacteria bacterium]|nr:AsmA-like C-terminal domain-containing protein [Deltaproteobacteria bacterium]